MSLYYRAHKDIARTWKKYTRVLCLECFPHYHKCLVQNKAVKALIYTSYMMWVIHFQLVFCVTKSVSENVLHFIDTVYKVLNRRISELQLLGNTRWIYLIKELHVPRAQSVCILKCFVTVVYSQTSSCTYFISEKVSNSSVSFISTSLSSKNI